jgi:predicted permease
MTIDFERSPAWRRYLRFWGHDAARDVDEELRFHLESRVSELVAEGWDEAAARRAAHERFGDVERIRLCCQELSEQRERTMRRSEWFVEIGQDLRYGWRTMLRAPGFTAVAVLSLAAGIGANTAIFGLLHKVVLERLPFPRPEQLVYVSRVAPALGSTLLQPMSDEQIDAIRGLPGIEFTTLSGTGAAVSVGNERTSFGIDAVEGTFFSVLGARPLQGRLITPEDDRSAAQVVVISQVLWQRYFPGDRAVIGKSIRINEIPFTIVGVTPASYRGVSAFGPFHAAVPYSTLERVRPARPGGAGRANNVRTVIGRLADDTKAAALEPLLQARLARCCGEQNAEIRAKGPAVGKSAPSPAGQGSKAVGAKGDAATSAGRVPPRVLLSDMSRGIAGKIDVRAQYSGLLYALMSGVMVLLLVACANVGTLLLARAETRRRELAVRYSLGAVRMRLIRQLLTESLQIALLGAVLGYFLSRWGLHFLASRMEQGLLTDLVTRKPNAAVLGFTTAVTVLSTILFGALPARRATQIDVVTQLREGGHRLGNRGTGILDRALIVVQVALALLLVTTSGLLVQTFHNLRTVKAGFDPAHLLLVRADFGKDRPYWENTIDDDLTLPHVQRLPGVRSAALVSTSPVFGSAIWLNTIDVNGYAPAPDEDMSARVIAITSDYYTTAGVGLRAGRAFNAADGPGAEAVGAVSATFAQRFLSDRNPLGAVVQMGESSFRVVAVVDDVRYENLREPERPVIYLPSTQFAGAKSEPLVLMIRTAGDPGALADLVQSEIRASGYTVNIRQIAEMQKAMDQSLLRERAAAILGTLFGALALALAALGLYGVIAYQVAGRTTEIGTRMALGARGAGVLWLVLRQSIALLTIGFAVGIPLALMAARALTAQLFGVRFFDPFTLGGALFVLTVAGAVATILPARRATRVDPLTALRAS